jgi:hypothetical protein
MPLRSKSSNELLGWRPIAVPNHLEFQNGSASGTSDYAILANQLMGKKD